MQTREIIEAFYTALFSYTEMMNGVYTEAAPQEMMTSVVDEEGWFSWKPIPGTLPEEAYHRVEQKFNVRFPKSFIEWHKKYYFLRAGLALVGLPSSNPKQPLLEVINNLDYDFAKDLVALKLYSFASDGGDRGPWVFDAREEVADHEYPVRICDYDFDGESEGLSEIIFSSFPKCLECLTHFLSKENTNPDYELILDFFRIDPDGAGKTGVDYWLNLSNCLREEAME